MPSGLTAQQWVAIAGIVSRNAVPIAGLLFLDWRAVNLVVLYFIDFMVDLAVCFTLFAIFDREAQAALASAPSTGAKARQIGGLLVGFLILAATFAFVFGMPVFGMLVTSADVSLESLFGDAGFRNGVLVHLALSSWTFLQVYRYFSRVSAADPKFEIGTAVKGRFGYVTTRWLAVYVAGLMVPFFPALMVIAYCAATAYSELFPKRFETLLGPP